jgi:DNA-damage-inducible protein D
LGYKWQRFEDAIQRAMTACEQSGNAAADHFTASGKMVPLGSGAEREIKETQASTASK